GGSTGLERRWCRAPAAGARTAAWPASATKPRTGLGRAWRLGFLAVEGGGGIGRAAQADDVGAGAGFVAAVDILAARIAMRRRGAGIVRHGVAGTAVGLVPLPGAVGDDAKRGNRRGAQDSHGLAPQCSRGRRSEVGACAVR